MTWLHGADRSQDFSKKYPGAAITADKIVLHTTEGPSWPGYDGGKNAPHLTIYVDPRTGAVQWRQHFALNRSSRALKNLPGGVETNIDDTIQVELIGTCDPRTVTGWARNSVLWPAAEEKHLAGVRAILRAVVAAVPTIPWQDAAPRGWAAYPGSYDNGAGQRMTFQEWRNSRGILGHQHVPENVHGDPGAFPIARLLNGFGARPTRKLTHGGPMTIYLHSENGRTIATLAHNGGFVVIKYVPEADFVKKNDTRPKPEYQNLIEAGVKAIWMDKATVNELIKDARGVANR